PARLLVDRVDALLLQGRYVRKLAKPFGAGDRQGADFTGLDLPEHLVGVGRGDIDMTAEQRRLDLAAAVEADVVELDVGFLLDLRQQQAVLSAEARATPTHAIRRLLRGIDQILDRLEG